MLGLGLGLPVLAASPPRLLPTVPTLRPPNPLTSRPSIPLLNTLVPSPPQTDRSSRFPLRREGGGTRAACASRLVAHLVPETGVLAGGAEGLIGLIEGQTPQPVELVMRLPGGTWLASPTTSASVRLFQRPQPAAEGLWESFPACEGPEEPMAPPARSLLLSASHPPLDRPYQEALQRLWRSCGHTLPTQTVLSGWAYGHLADQLPAELAVICERLPQASGSGASTSGL
jgi:hypothetical protein